MSQAGPQEDREHSRRASTLRKGKACVCCRRRKMKCDGARPVCVQCSTNGREMDCEYTDSFAPTRTELLEEYLSRLQNRIDELESVRNTTTLRYRGRQEQGLSHSQARIAHPSTRWWQSEIPPPAISQTLVDIFSRHELQVGWALNTSRIVDALSTPPSDPTFPHLALVNAVYLWGAHLSRNDLLSTPEIERAFFERSSAYLQTHFDNLTPQKCLQLIQTEILLSHYLFIFGRTLETEYHANAAVRLALSYGLHRIVPHQLGGTTDTLSPPADAVEEGEKISLFWSVFLLDHSWAIAHAKPAALRLDGESGTIITTPWPLSTAEYEQGNVTYSSSGLTQPLREFLEEHGNSSSGYSPLALSIKAGLLCERATYVGALRSSSGRNVPSHDDLRALDETIFNFVQSLAQIDAETPSNLKGFFIGIHSVAYLAFIRLHDSVALSDVGAYTRCLQAARYIAALVGIFKEGEIMYLCASVLPAITVACKVLIREVSRAKHAPPSYRLEGATAPDVLQAELGKTLSSLAHLSPLYPAIDPQLSSLAEMRVKLQI